MPGSSNSSRCRTCTAIVCAYNEARTLAAVLDTLLVSPLINDIVAIDDGSTDETADVLRSYAGHEKLHAIFLPQNRGKGYAMAEGVLRAKGEAILFVDADLLNLEPDHFAQILHPLIEGEADMIIGNPSRGQGLIEAMNPLRPLSGERALFRKDIFPLMETIRNSRFGVETLINLHYRRESKSVRYVLLRGLVHPIKLEKTNLMEAAEMYALEGSQIIKALARHYPLAMAAYGLDPRKAQLWWNRASDPLRSAWFTEQARRAMPHLEAVRWPRALSMRLMVERARTAQTDDPQGEAIASMEASSADYPCRSSRNANS